MIMQTDTMAGAWAVDRQPWRAEYLDFRDRTHGAIEVEAVGEAVAAGRFVWIDVDLEAAARDAALAGRLPAVVGGLPLGAIVAGLTAHAADSRSTLSRHDDWLHLVLVGAAPWLAAGSEPSDSAAGCRLELAIAAECLLTVHRGPHPVLDAVRATYLHDFQHHARTPSFLVYEICEEQVEQFLHIHAELEDQVEAVRRQLGGHSGEGVFVALADVSGRLLELRRRALGVRRVLDELVARRSTLVSEATLDCLGRMSDTLERLLTDIASDREVLESSLNFQLTVLGHRTNTVMNRLAVVSTIFLPLSFLCGVYGMNFEGIPEIEWQHGYVYFWLLSAGITTLLVALLRRARLL